MVVASFFCVGKVRMGRNLSGYSVFLVRRFADSISVDAEGFCPAERAFFLSLNKKKQKVNTGAAPLCTRQGQGQR